ncbi:MAG TPA: hypothetical protein DEO95_08320, partial [Ruminococcaceae bacterium]|nr:hypothetical protein [Oscillospiraceae bacterium]
MGRFIWLIGENLGKSATNNAFYFWRTAMEQEDDIDKYLVLEKNENNLALYKTLPEQWRTFILWRNTIEHLKLYVAADMFFVAQSYRDVRPEKVMGRTLDLSTEKPVVYLQHGTLSMKVIGYNGKSYNNNFFRFVYYNKLVKEAFMQTNDFKDYQMYYCPYQPRYMEMV